MKLLLTAILVVCGAVLAGPKDIDGPLDQRGRPFQLSSLGEERLVVVAFLGVECPLAGLYANRLNELAAAYRARGQFIQPAGCAIEREITPSRDATVTYAKDIAPILDDHCAACHRPGEAAPFSLLTYADTVAWNETLREVLVASRMPPWSATGGPFINDRSLSDRERRLVLQWLDDGACEGNAAQRPPLPSFPVGWTIRPDRVFAMAAPFAVPKEGVLDYQEFTIDPGFARDRGGASGRAVSLNHGVGGVYRQDVRAPIPLTNRRFV